MTTLIVCAAIFGFALSIGMFIIYQMFKKRIFIYLGCIFAAMTFWFTGWITARQCPNEIPAIEVYRGNTTLKIHGYKVDGKFVPEDSTVVYKPHIVNPALQDTTELLNIKPQE